MSCTRQCWSVAFDEGPASWGCVVSCRGHSQSCVVSVSCGLSCICMLYRQSCVLRVVWLWRVAVGGWRTMRWRMGVRSVCLHVRCGADADRAIERNAVRQPAKPETALSHVRPGARQPRNGTRHWTRQSSRHVHGNMDHGRHPKKARVTQSPMATLCVFSAVQCAGLSECSTRASQS